MNVLHKLAFVVALVLPALAAEKPNFVFIFSDDVNRDTWGVYGNPDCKTPHIDKLAAEGMLFENMYCAVAMLVRSVASATAADTPPFSATNSLSSS